MGKKQQKIWTYISPNKMYNSQHLILLLTREMQIKIDKTPLHTHNFFYGKIVLERMWRNRNPVRYWWKRTMAQALWETI